MRASGIGTDTRVDRYLGVQWRLVLTVAAADEDPFFALATMASWGPAFPRIARWVEAGLEEVGAHADVVYLDRPPVGAAGATGCRPDGGRGRVHRIALGAGRARSALPRLIGYLRDRRPAVTVATPGTIGCVAMVAGALARQRVLPWEQTVPRMDRADLPVRLRAAGRGVAACYARAPLVVTVSEGVRDALAAELAPRLGPDRFVVIPNPIDAEEVRRVATPPAPRSGRLRLCSIGRLVSAKGFDVLVDALALADLGEAWELVIVGEGPLRPEIERLVVERGLEEHVRLVGHVANPYPLLASADVAVQASRWEGFGIAVLEALALGVPLVATSCPGGVGEILADGRFGVLVPPGDPHELARAISATVDDRTLRDRLTELGPSRAASYSPARVATQMVDLARGAPRWPAPVP